MTKFSFPMKFVCGIAGTSLAGSFTFFAKSLPDEKDNSISYDESESLKSYKWDYNWDKRDPKSLLVPKKSRSAEREARKLRELKPTATRHILLIRHGQYHTKAHSQDEMTLTALGREQAWMVGQRLKDLDLPYSKLIRSTLIRAIETSDIIHKYLPNLPVETSELLEEGTPIPCEPKTGHYRLEHESFQGGARIEAAFRKYFHRATPEQKSDSYEIIVCHANVIRYFVCRLLQVPPEAWLRFSLYHCSITWTMIYPNGQVTVRSYGDSGFLSRKQMTTR